MAITFPDRINSGNVQSIWFARLYHDNEGANDWIGIATSEFYSGTDDYYYPIIKNKPSIRTSIDLVNSKSKTSDVTFECLNNKLGNKTISQELLYGNKNFINRKVEISQAFWELGSIGSETLIFVGRLVDVSHNHESCTLKIQTARAWDFISIPNESAYNDPSIYTPIAYGDSYSVNDSTFNTPLDCEPYLFPVPVIDANKDEVHCLMPRSYSSGSNAHLNHSLGKRIFLPFSWSSGGQYEITHTEHDRNVLRFNPKQGNVGIITPLDFTAENTGDSGRVYFQNTHLMFDEDSTTFSTAFCASGNNHYFGFTSGAKGWCSPSQGKNSLLFVKFDVKDTGGHSFNIIAYKNSPISGNANAITTYSTARTLTSTPTTHTITFGSPKPKISDPIGILFIRTSTNGGSASTTISVNNIKIGLVNAIEEDSNGVITNEFLHRLEKVEEFYSGGNGLSRSYTGGSGDVSTIPEAHRDILKRFVGINETSPSGFSALNSARSNWKIRYWLKKPKSLDEVLEKLQYEGGFIFTFTPTGTMKYIFVNSSYGSSDHTFGDEDLSNLKISHTPITSLLTKYDIKYNKLPNDTYDSSKLYENTSSRNKWNIQSEENIQEIKLDALCTTTGADNFYNYYSNLSSDIKILLEGNIVNPAKWGVEVGDIIKMETTLTPFGNTGGGSDYNWYDQLSSGNNNYFMITDLTRTLDSVKFKAMEVG